MKFKRRKVAHEHIYWDQACVLAQIGSSTRANCPSPGRRKPKPCLKNRAASEREFASAFGRGCNARRRITHLALHALSFTLSYTGYPEVLPSAGPSGNPKHLQRLPGLSLNSSRCHEVALPIPTVFFLEAIQ